MKSITASECKHLFNSGEDYQLVDVREPYEYEIVNLGGELIPLGEIPENIDQISKDKKVVFLCRSGVRSARAIEYLEQHGGFDNLYNIEGGVVAWKEEVDDSIPLY